MVLFGKHPILIPEVAPYGEEGRRNEKTNIRRDADGFKARNYKVVEYKADALNN